MHAFISFHGVGFGACGGLCGFEASWVFAYPKPNPPKTRTDTVNQQPQARLGFRVTHTHTNNCCAAKPGIAHPLGPETSEARNPISKRPEDAIKRWQMRFRTSTLGMFKFGLADLGYLWPWPWTPHNSQTRNLSIVNVVNHNDKRAQKPDPRNP